MEKRKRPRRGFVACPACGVESRAGLKTCPECGVKLPGAGGGGAFWIVAIIILGIAAIGVGAYMMRGQPKQLKKKKKPPAELAQPPDEKPAEKPKAKPAEEETESVLDLFGAGSALPEPTIEGPEAGAVKPDEEESEGTLKE